MRGKHKISLAVAALVAGAAAFFVSMEMFGPGTPQRSVPTEKSEAPAGPAPKEEGLLYFASRDNRFLTAERRVFDRPETPSDFARLIVQELIDGPRGDLLPTIPEKTLLKALTLDGERTAYVDFSVDIAVNHPGGAASELLTIYSIVNSLTLNVGEIEKVKILIDGREAQTLAGHVDLRSPFNSDMMLIR